MKILVFTRRTALPSSMKELRKLTNFTPIVSQLDTQEVLDFCHLLRREKLEDISMIFIDGLYRRSDHKLMKPVLTMDKRSLRLHFALQFTLGVRDLPESFEVLRLVTELKEKNIPVFFFVDKPSEILKKELSDRGASVVWTSLHKPSDFQKSATRLGVAVKSTLNELANLGRSLVKQK